MKVSAHLTEEVIEQYRAGNLSAAEWLAVQEHVGACAECRARLARGVIYAGAGLLDEARAEFEADFDALCFIGCDGELSGLEASGVGRCPCPARAFVAAHLDQIVIGLRRINFEFVLNGFGDGWNPAERLRITVPRQIAAGIKVWKAVAPLDCFVHVVAVTRFFAVRRNP